MITNDAEVLDPLGDAEDEAVKNRAKVGSARPSSLLYTYGPGSIMDLPGFATMPAGLDDWDRIWKRRQHIPAIEEPRLLDVARLHLGNQVESLRPFPWQPKQNPFSPDGDDLGIPARVFPQWLRCTGCDMLAPLPRFAYENTHPFRPDQARFVHNKCPGRRPRGGTKKKSSSKRQSPGVPAQHLLTCTNGHLDEFPYDLWVHRGTHCPKVESPALKMREPNLGGNIGSIVECQSCGLTRTMAEGRGRAGREKLPQVCRGRHPHLNAFDATCQALPALIMMGASNLWFGSIQSTIVMPRTAAEEQGALADRLRRELGADKLEKYSTDLGIIRDLADGRVALGGIDDDQLGQIVSEAMAPGESEEARLERRANWDPVELLVPEWEYLQQETLEPDADQPDLLVTEVERGPELPPGISRVIAVDKMKKINAVLGFTRLDEMDRVNDVARRLVKLTRDGKPTWIPATEDRGEGIFLQLDLDAVAAWEQTVEASALWQAHRQSHRRNFQRRFSETAKAVDPDSRLPSPRYWLLHTLAHILIREMAMTCGYGAASLTERIYGWTASPERRAAAGILICTTASDSEGTLGGLVALAEPRRLQDVVNAALRRMSRCSSDPICAMRTPSDPEDFLHGAACHCCTFASETSCERANRFLDRRFLLSLPTAAGELTVEGFFGSIDAL